MQVADHFGLFHLRRAGIEQPCLGVMGIAHLEERRLLLEVDIERMLVARREGVALDLVVQGGRRAGDGEQIRALLAQLGQAGQQRPGTC